MEEAVKSAISVLLGYGLPGVIIIVLLFVSHKLFNKYEEQVEGRRKDALANQEGFRDNTEVIRQVTSEMQAVKQTISAMADAQRVTNSKIDLMSIRPRDRDQSGG